MKYYLIAGEASGDLHASNLMKALRQEDPEAVFRFYGGEKMAAVGGTLVKHYRELAYMGFIPVLLHLPTILRNMRRCKADIEAWNPDVVILVDYPGFNLNIAEYVHQLAAQQGTKGERRTKVFYYISPKIWAWKEYRIKNIRRDVDELFSILPFEVQWFADRGYPIHYVGNPCVDAVESTTTPEEGRAKQQIAILAGSRRQEIKDNLCRMLKAASTFKDYKLVIAGAPNIERSYYERYIPQGLEIDVRFGETYQVLRESVAALVTSGTATLETAILRVPQVVCYYIPCGKFVSWLRSKILKVKYISLANLVVDREIVPELVADRMTHQHLVNHLAAILPGGDRRQQMLDDYEEMNRMLGPAGASVRAAKEMVKLLNN